MRRQREHPRFMSERLARQRNLTNGFLQATLRIGKVGAVYVKNLGQFVGYSR